MLFHPIQVASLSRNAKLSLLPLGKAMLELEDAISSTEIQFLFAGQVSNLLVPVLGSRESGLP